MADRRRPGQPLDISAEVWNSFLDTVREQKGKKHDRLADALDQVRQADIIKVRNDSGADRLRFHVLGISSPIITPSEHLREFKNQVALAGVKPKHPRHFTRFPVSPTLGVEGPQPVLHAVEDNSAAVSLVDELIAAACRTHKTQPSEIAVLSLETIGESSPWTRAKLGGRRVSNNPEPDHITVTTARRFKGLEASLILVVDADFSRAIDPLWRLLLYVACSRARHAVHIVTTTPESALAEAVEALAGTDKARPSWRALCRFLGVRRGGKSDAPFN